MMIPISSVSNLSDDDLLTHVQRAAHEERHATAQLIALLIELDSRRLYLGQGYASLFTYCTQVLHLSEPAAYKRIRAARAAHRFPMILERLCDGAITLTAINVLAPHLTPANHVDVLDAARQKSRSEVEHLVARLHPRPDVPATIRKLPERNVAPVPTEPKAVEPQKARDQPPPLLRPQALPKPTSDVKPLAPERYKIQVTVNRDTYEKLRRAQDLMRHSVANGDPAAIFDRALTLLLEHLEKTKLAAAHRPRTERKPARGRHIPAAVKRAVWQRDGGQCGFKGAQGRRCTETGFLEFHHVVPFAAGGETAIANLELRCRAHNAHEAEQYFGPRNPPPLVRERREPYMVEPAARSGASFHSCADNDAVRAMCWGPRQRACSAGDSHLDDPAIATELDAPT